MSDKPLFHELSPAEYDALKQSGATWAEVMDAYRQPDWCNYPGALEGWAGCWSLIQGAVSDRDFCRQCDCYQAEEDHDDRNVVDGCG